MEVHAPGMLVALLAEDHELIAHRFSDVNVAGTSTRRESFWKLVDALIRHEVAEEVVVYPLIRAIPGGERIADKRLAEQGEAEQWLAQMESLDPGSDEFAARLGALQKMVLTHARREEAEVFPLLRSHLPSEDKVTLGERYLAAKMSAPSHPHPSIPDTLAGHAVMGRVAALLDRIRDAAARV